MANIHDVARLAGVSTATVSRYLAGEHVRSAPAVAAAVKQLSYRPSITARNLRTGRHLAVGVVVPDIANPFFAAVTRGVENVVAPHGLQVAIANSGEDVQLEAEAVDALQRRVDGVILAPATETDVVPQRLASSGLPVVFVDRGVSGANFDLVEVDNADGARQAAEHLVRLGHRAIGLISGPLSSTPGRERHDAFLGALEAMGVQISAEYIELSDFKEAGGYAAMTRLLTLTDHPSAVFVSNNLMSIGALKAASDLGMRIPGDISMLGFDDLDLAPLLDPPYTVIDRPTITQGEEAGRLMIDRLTDPTRSPERVILPVRLVVRSSTAAPNGRVHE